MFCKRWISRYNKGYNQLVKIGGIVLTIDIKDIENMQNKVKLIRQTLEIGIQDFADLLGVSRQTIYNIESFFLSKVFPNLHLKYLHKHL